MVVDGPSDSRNTFLCRYQTRTHRTGINDIDTGVTAVVDAGDKQVDTLILEHYFAGQFHAVRRCAVRCIDLSSVEVMFLNTTQIDRCRYTDGRSFSATRTIRCNDKDFAYLGHLFGQQAYSCRAPTVIVDNYYIHPFTTAITFCAKAFASSIVAASE